MNSFIMKHDGMLHYLPQKKQKNNTKFCQYHLHLFLFIITIYPSW